MDSFCSGGNYNAGADILVDVVVPAVVDVDDAVVVAAVAVVVVVVVVAVVVLVVFLMHVLIPNYDLHFGSDGAEMGLKMGRG